MQFYLLKWREYYKCWQLIFLKLVNEGESHCNKNYVYIRYLNKLCSQIWRHILIVLNTQVTNMKNMFYWLSYVENNPVLVFFVSIGITSSMYSFGGTCICSNHWMFSLALERVNYEGYSVDFEIAPNVNI